jgi:hypothetical protein
VNNLGPLDLGRHPEHARLASAAGYRAILELSSRLEGDERQPAGDERRIVFGKSRAGDEIRVKTSVSMTIGPRDRTVAFVTLLLEGLTSKTSRSSLDACCLVWRRGNCTRGAATTSKGRGGITRYDAAPASLAGRDGRFGRRRRHRSQRLPGVTLHCRDLLNRSWPDPGVSRAAPGSPLLIT